MNTRSAQLEDLAGIESLLASVSLPLAGVRERLNDFIVIESDGKIIGVAGVEIYGREALLRSVAVDPAQRGRGLARRLVDDALTHAKSYGVRSAYLLTTTAESYFPRLNFRVLDRASAPPTIQQSSEFRDLCPSTAVLMVRPL